MSGQGQGSAGLEDPPTTPWAEFFDLIDQKHTWLNGHHLAASPEIGESPVTMDREEPAALTSPMISKEL
jgi:hypothetical protein